MSEKPYLKYMQDHHGMILRDYLAIDRTLLANETSFMSYVRTSLTLIAAGVTLIKFFDSEYVQFLGWLFVAVGGWLSIHGYHRYRKVDTLMNEVKGDDTQKSNVVEAESSASTRVIADYRRAS